MVLRQKVWIDHHVQGVLVGRVVLYWSGILLYFGLSMGCSQWWQYPEWTFGEHLVASFEQIWPCMLTFALLLPLVIFDFVRLSNRFVGPVYRLKSHLLELNENANAQPLNFRDDDYWQQLTEPINDLQRKIQALETEVETLKSSHEAPAAEPAVIKPSGGVNRLLVSEYVEPLPTHAQC